MKTLIKLKKIAFYIIAVLIFVGFTLAYWKVFVFLSRKHTFHGDDLFIALILFLFSILFILGILKSFKPKDKQE